MLEKRLTKYYSMTGKLSFVERIAAWRKELSYFDSVLFC